MMQSQDKTEYNEKDILQKVVAGKISFRNIDKLVENVDSAVHVRRNALEEITGPGSKKYRIIHLMLR